MGDNHPTLDVLEKTSKTTPENTTISESTKGILDALKDLLVQGDKKDVKRALPYTDTNDTVINNEKEEPTALNLPRNEEPDVEDTNVYAIITLIDNMSRPDDPEVANYHRWNNDTTTIRVLPMRYPHHNPPLNEGMMGEHNDQFIVMDKDGTVRGFKKVKSVTWYRGGANYNNNCNSYNKLH